MSSIFFKFFCSREARAGGWFARSAARRLAIHPWFQGQSVTVIPHVLDTDRLANVEPIAPAPGRLRIVLFGFLGRDKGIEDLLDALEIVAARGQIDTAALEVEIFGGAPQGFRDAAWYRALAQRAAAHPMAEHIRFEPGIVSHAELHGRLAGADIVVLPTRRVPGVDASSGTTIRAMGLGRVVVTTHSGPRDELIEDGRTGLLVGERDSEALADAIERLAADPSLRKALGRAARQTILDRHSPAAAAEHLRAIYGAVSADLEADA